MRFLSHPTRYGSAEARHALALLRLHSCSIAFVANRFVATRVSCELHYDGRVANAFDMS
jgi:hypothetical protein